MASREPAPDSDALDAELVDLLASELLDPGSPAKTAGKQRLLAETAQFPRRYAPFVPKLAALWDLTEPAVEAWLAEAPPPAAWRRTWFGVRSLRVPAGPALRGCEVRLVRFGTGVKFARHRHVGDETVFVLEGSYTDSHGVTVRPGDAQTMRDGSEHALQISATGPCVATTIRGGLVFTEGVLGRISRWAEAFRRA